MTAVKEEKQFLQENGKILCTLKLHLHYVECRMVSIDNVDAVWMVARHCRSQSMLSRVECYPKQVGMDKRKSN